MLACVTDCEEISQNPTNNSRSKQLFSFPKGKRFLHYPQPYNNILSYGQKSDFAINKLYGKSSGFGVGGRPELFP